MRAAIPHQNVKGLVIHWRVFLEDLGTHSHVEANYGFVCIVLGAKGEEVPVYQKTIFRLTAVSSFLVGHSKKLVFNLMQEAIPTGASLPADAPGGADSFHNAVGNL